MTDSDSTYGRFTDEEQEYLSSWLSEKWVNTNGCPIDGTVDWSLHPTLVAPANIEFVNDGESEMPQARFSGDAFPLAAVVCSNCGYTFFLNLMTTGLYSAAEDNGNEVDGVG